MLNTQFNDYLHNCTITTSNVQILLLVFKNGII